MMSTTQSISIQETLGFSDIYLSNSYKTVPIFRSDFIKFSGFVNLLHILLKSDPKTNYRYYYLK